MTEAQNAHSSVAADSHMFKISKYQCSFCSKVFPRAWHLKNHIRVHTGVRPFVCQICNKGFNQLGNLNTHLRIHTGEKPFKCTVCNYCFLRSNDLKLHMMKKHFQ